MPTPQVKPEPTQENGTSYSSVLEHGPDVSRGVSHASANAEGVESSGWVHFSQILDTWEGGDQTSSLVKVKSKTSERAFVTDEVYSLSQESTESLKWSVRRLSLGNSVPIGQIGQRARAHVTNRNRELLTAIRAIVLSTSYEARVPVTNVLFDSFTDPNEGWTRVICRVSVECLAEQALAYWDYLGAVVDRWRRALGAEEAGEVAGNYSVYVEWV